MIYIENKSINPSYNHALEEYFMKDTDQSVFMLWQNEPTVLVGRNQNVDLEVDKKYTKDHGIHVIRRKSGGGAIFCDLGNMQYSFITDNDGSANSFQLFAMPVVDALKKLGIHAEFTGRNDIIADGKKISGNAQYKWKKRIVHHGTLLFNVDNIALKNSLKTRDIKFVDKSVKSISSRIGLIKDMVDMDVYSFMNYIRDNIIDYYNIKEFRSPSEYEKEALKKYLDEFPELNDSEDETSHKYYMAKKYSFGLVEYGLDLEEDKIVELKIAGDYFEERDINEYLNELRGIRLDELKDIGLDIGDYILGFNNDDFINDILNIKE